MLTPDGGDERNMEAPKWERELSVAIVSDHQGRSALSSSKPRAGPRSNCKDMGIRVGAGFALHPSRD